MRRLCADYAQGWAATLDFLTWADLAVRRICGLGFLSGLFGCWLAGQRGGYGNVTRSRDYAQWTEMVSFLVQVRNCRTATNPVTMRNEEKYKIPCSNCATVARPLFDDYAQCLKIFHFAQNRDTVVQNPSPVH